MPLNLLSVLISERETFLTYILWIYNYYTVDIQVIYCGYTSIIVSRIIRLDFKFLFGKFLGVINLKMRLLYEKIFTEIVFNR